MNQLSHVINYELPNISETYVHRIGCTGRAGHDGIAISFCESEELPYLKDIQKLTDKDVITVETLSGIKTLKLNVENGKVKTVRVNMGAPILECDKVPVKYDDEKMINKPVKVDGKTFNITCVSMGNPHAVTFINDTDNLEIEKIGPKFENNEIFPDKINTEFIQIIDKKTVKMRVWERGSGETFACGTGACASVVASVLNRLTENKVTVKLLGGELEIEYNQDENTVYMTGPARVVFTGEYDI